jgi:L-lactate utilization protein LutB
MSATATPPHAVEVEHEPSFATRYETALANPRLARNVTRYQQNWRVSRNASMVDVSFEELRDSLTAAKNQVLENLEGYIAEFEAMATANGAVIHHAKTADDAKRIVREIAQARGIDLIVKSKSMVTEEIELNHYLEAFDIEPVETDLGEWIIQKAGQRPSHIVGPALHMGREDVGDLLNDKLGLTVSREDIPEQVHAIRDLIRPKFFEAGMGMTGANALIAETGTVMMATNEGNGRLASSAPPCHVVMAGIEKLIPTFEDAVTPLFPAPRRATRCISSWSITAGAPCATGLSSSTPSAASAAALAPMSARPIARSAAMCSGTSTPARSGWW